MDYIALVNDSLWKDLWDSKYIRSLVAQHENLLLNARLDQVSTSRVAGRLSILRDLQKMVENEAQKQLDDQRQQTSEASATKRRSILPRIA